MSSSKDSDVVMGIVSLVLAILVIVGCVGWRWYSAGVQATVYQRQGIEMTQWECFVGSHPAERTINIKESGK